MTKDYQIIYLNSFTPKDVIEVIEAIDMSDKDKYLVWWNRPTKEELADFNMVSIHYEPMLHRMFVKEYIMNRPLWLNPQANGLIVPKDKFLSMIDSKEFDNMLQGI